MTAPHIIRHGEPSWLPGETGEVRTPWSCSCGATGEYGVGCDEAGFIDVHLREVAAPILPGLGVDELVEALHRGVSQAPATAVAATELIMRHGYWLADPELRSPDYLETQWTEQGQMVVRVLWGGLAVAGSAGDAVALLGHFLPRGLDDQVWSWLHPANSTPGEQIEQSGPFTRHPAAAIAVLRIAVTIAGGVPVRLGDEVARLDERTRLLVGAALAQMLASAS